jgi:hypothetical protein
MKYGQPFCPSISQTVRMARGSAGAILLRPASSTTLWQSRCRTLLPFLAEVLAIGFGVWCGDWRLIFRGLRGVTLNVVFAIAAGLSWRLLTEGKETPLALQCVVRSTRSAFSEQ